MRLQGKELNIDVFGELEPYLEQFKDYRIRGDKLQSCSPFRYEKHPSFAVNLENGLWIDSGSPTEDNYKGNLVSLLAVLSGSNYHDMEQDLIQRYDYSAENTKGLKLHLEPITEKKTASFNWREMKHLHYRSTYLNRRGITEEIQKLFCIGYDRERRLVAIPWIHTDKTIINIKYRSVTGKKFLYEEGGELVRNYVYGLYQCRLKGHRDVCIVEAEIDAMYLWSNGYPAIALGHAGIQDSQVRMLLNNGIETVTIVTDNDAAGKRFAKKLTKILPQHFNVYTVEIPEGYKDINEVQDKQLVQEIIGNRRKLNIIPDFRV